MTVYFYIPNKALNEATIYYTKIIEKAFVEDGIEVQRKNKLDFVFNKSEDLVFTIRVIDFLKVHIKYRTYRICVWYQGLLGEEYRMIHKNSFKSKIVDKLFKVFEKYSLKKSFFSFFVSTSMKEYFEKKHSIKLDVNNLIIPCYNKALNNSFFKVSKEKNTFVYAGTLFAWQCFEDTVKLFKQIEDCIVGSKLIVLTKEQVEAKEILDQYQVLNYEIRFVKLDDLDKELSCYEYGFLLREKHIVNQVSTPTKMNSYLSVGLIPIYTDVIDSFEDNLNLEPYAIKCKLEDNEESIVDKISRNRNVDYHAYYKLCENNFKEYYDDFYNIESIKRTLIKMLR